MKMFLKVAMVVSVLTGVAVNARAHVAVGKYQGVDQDGMACALELTKVAFEQNIKHPLNERVSVIFRGENWTLIHAPTVDAVAATVGFDHDALSQTIANGTGASALVVKIDHTPGREGPSELTFIVDNWKDDAGDSKFTCADLKLVP